MMWRLREMPRYSTTDSSVGPRHYNQLRLALRRLPGPIRVTLSGLPHIDMIIDNDSWVCVDTSLNDLPVLAWTDFNHQARQGLHEPMACKLHYFHYRAGNLVLNALDASAALLARQIARLPHPPPSQSRPGRSANRRHGLHVVN